MPVIILSGMPDAGQSLLLHYLLEVLPRADTRTVNPIGPTPKVIPAAFREALFWPGAGDQEFLIYPSYGYPDHWVFQQTYSNVFTPEIKALADRMKFYRPLIIIVWPSDWHEYMKRMKQSHEATKQILKRFKYFMEENKVALVEIKSDDIQLHAVSRIVGRFYREKALSYD